MRYDVVFTYANFHKPDPRSDDMSWYKISVLSPKPWAGNNYTLSSVVPMHMIAMAEMVFVELEDGTYESAKNRRGPYKIYDKDSPVVKFIKVLPLTTKEAVCSKEGIRIKL